MGCSIVVHVKKDKKINCDVNNTKLKPRISVLTIGSVTRNEKTAYTEG